MKKQKLLFIADYFANEIHGGGELFNQELFSYFQRNGYEVKCDKSINIDPQYLKVHQKHLIFISNFVQLSTLSKAELRNGEYKYAIIEHDHKYLKSRNPLAYKNMLAPEEEIINFDFYRKAKAIFAQSKIHAEIIQKNLFINNIVNVGCNLFSDSHLSLLEGLVRENECKEKTYEYSVFNSPNPIKGKKEALEYCQQKNITPHLINPSDQETFYEELCKTKNFIFLPQTFETYSRVYIEAKILGCKVISNKAIGVLSEDYSKLSGRLLLDRIREEKQSVLGRFKNFVDNDFEVDWSFYITPIQYPKISVISTIYKAEQFMEGLLKSYVEQEEIYGGEIELIILDANSPANEQKIVQDFLKKNSFANIQYIHWDTKITTMEAFNILEKKASGEYIVILLADDRLSKDYCHVMAKHLRNNPEVDLVYSDVLVTKKPNETFEENSSGGLLFEHTKHEFSKENLIKSLGGPCPMYKREKALKCPWNKDRLHSGDWQKWLDMVVSGSTFLKVNKPLVLYYENPEGLSTSPNEELTRNRRKQEREVFEEYGPKVFPENYKRFKQYFDQFKNL